MKKEYRPHESREINELVKIANLYASSLSLDTAVSILQISYPEIQWRQDRRKIYTFKSLGKVYLPLFQTNYGRFIENFDILLPLIRPDVPPQDVNDFFISNHPQIFFGENTTITPRQHIMYGGNPTLIRQLAPHLFTR